MTRTEISSARELPRTVAHFVIPENYRGDNPKDYAVWTYGDWRLVESADATYVEISIASYSDYSGSTVEASNWRSLIRDWPNTFVEVSGDYGTRSLLLPIEMPADFRAGDDDETRADFWRHLLAEIASLEDYPVYDEGDMSALEMELADDAWDNYLRYDVRRALEEAGLSDDVLDGTEDKLREMFYAITGESAEPYYAESAVSVVFPSFDDTIKVMANAILETQGEK